MARPGMLDPKRDLKGATPEKLAAALLRRNVERQPEKPRKTDAKTIKNS